MTTPLSLADFFSLLPVSKVSFHRPGLREQSRTAGGSVRSAILGEGLWTGTVILDQDFHREAAAILAILEELDEGGAPFLIHPMPVWSPASDPEGALLAGYSPRLHTISAEDRHLVRISGLPPEYTLAAGEMISLTYGAAPLRYGLHRIRTASVTANGEGVTPLFRVGPYIRPGAVAHPITGALITLVKPVCKAVITPGSISWPSAEGGLTEGVAFGFTQVLGV